MKLRSSILVLLFNTSGYSSVDESAGQISLQIEKQVFYEMTSSGPQYDSCSQNFDIAVELTQPIVMKKFDEMCIDLGFEPPAKLDGVTMLDCYLKGEFKIVRFTYAATCE